MYYSFINISVYHLFAHPYPTSLPGGTGKRRLEVGEHALVSGHPEHWIIQPKLHSCQSATYDHNAYPSQTDGWTDKWTDGETDEHHGNSAMIRSNECIAR